MSLTCILRDDKILRLIWTLVCMRSDTNFRKTACVSVSASNRILVIISLRKTADTSELLRYDYLILSLRPLVRTVLLTRDTFRFSPSLPKRVNESTVLFMQSTKLAGNR